jgi:hypothetical protein
MNPGINKFINDVCDRLEQNSVEYMISGSIALNFYCIPRMTLDVDIVIELEEEKIDTFIAMFPDSYIDKDTVRSEVRRKGMFNVIHNQTGFKIDFIIRKNSEYSKLAFKNRKIKKGIGKDFRIIDLNDLIIAKIMWIQDYQSEKQMNDIRNLLDNSEKRIGYIKEWCKTLNLQTFGLLDNE